MLPVEELSQYQQQIEQEKVKIKELEHEMKIRQPIVGKTSKCAEFVRGIIADEYISDSKLKALNKYLQSENIDDNTYQQALAILDLTKADIEDMKSAPPKSKFICDFCTCATHDNNTKSMFGLTDKQIKLLVIGYLNMLKVSNIADLIIFLINAYYERGYKLLHCHWDPKFIYTDGSGYDDMQICSQCKKTVISNAYGDVMVIRNVYCDIDHIYGMANKEIIAQFHINGGYQYWIGIHCGDFNNTYWSGFMNDNDGQYYLWTSEGYVESHDKKRDLESHDMMYGNDDIVYMKILFVANNEFGSLHFKKNDIGKWIDTQYKIDKHKKFKIAAAMHCDAILTLLSVKVKDNNPITMENVI